MEASNNTSDADSEKVSPQNLSHHLVSLCQPSNSYSAAIHSKSCRPPSTASEYEFCLCRSREICGHKWNSLPPHLMGLVIDHFDNKTIASIRLVSKAWHAAVKEHPVSPKPTSDTRAADLQRLCQILPNMSELELSSGAERLNLNLLSALSKLTHLSLARRDFSWTPRPELRASLGGLPSSLRSLQLEFIDVCPHNVKHVKFVSLTSLSFCFRENPKSCSLEACAAFATIEGKSRRLLVCSFMSLSYFSTTLQITSCLLVLCIPCSAWYS